MDSYGIGGAVSSVKVLKASMSMLQRMGTPWWLPTFIALRGEDKHKGYGGASYNERRRCRRRNCRRSETSCSRARTLEKLGLGLGADAGDGDHPAWMEMELGEIQVRSRTSGEGRSLPEMTSGGGEQRGAEGVTGMDQRAGPNLATEKRSAISFF